MRLTAQNGTVTISALGEITLNSGSNGMVGVRDIVGAVASTTLAMTVLDTHAVQLGALSQAVGTAAALQTQLSASTIGLSCDLTTHINSYTRTHTQTPHITHAHTTHAYALYILYMLLHHIYIFSCTLMIAAISVLAQSKADASTVTAQLAAKADATAASAAVSR